MEFSYLFVGALVQTYSKNSINPYAFQLNCLVIKYIYPMYLFSLFLHAKKELT